MLQYYVLQISGTSLLHGDRLKLNVSLLQAPILPDVDNQIYPFILTSPLKYDVISVENDCSNNNIVYFTDPNRLELSLLY